MSHLNHWLLPPDLWADKVISQNPEGGGFLVEGFENQVGYRSVCTPGAVAGLWEVHHSNERLEWGETIEPSIQLAQGFPLPAETRTAWRVDEPQRSGYVSPVEKLGWTPGSRAIYVNDDGSPYRAASDPRGGAGLPISLPNDLAVAP